MNDIAREFWSRMEAAEQKLSMVSDDEARQPYRPDGWTRKQVLGHLVDSACVNHTRIAFAATQGSFEGPAYDQNAWVTLHAWNEIPWAVIVDQWRSRYTWMAEMITNLPQAALQNPLTIAGYPTVTLGAWIRDCLDHLEHHIHQITEAAAGV
jgi:hypothetical protein